MHPLEPLSKSDVQCAVEILKSNDIIRKDNRIRIISITLYEDEHLKHAVYLWNDDKNTKIDRVAEAVIFDNDANRGSHIIMNLTCLSVVNTKQFPISAQPTISVDEMFECEQAVINSDIFKAALKKHYGNVDSSLVIL